MIFPNGHEKSLLSEGSFALDDDDKVDLRQQSRFSFTLDDDDLDHLSLQLVS